MKDSLSGLELHYLLQELQSLVNSRLDKPYQGLKERKRDFTFQFHVSGEGKRHVRLLLPGILFAASAKPSYEAMPGHFAVFLRKRVGNARVLAIRQRGFDRIFEIVLDKGHATYTLLVELLPPGNALLLDEEGKILNLLEPQRHGQRVLRGGTAYLPPPPIFDTKSASEEAIVERLSTSGMDSIVKAIASDLGFGGAFAEEVCTRLAIEKSRNDLTKAELANVASLVKTFFTLEPHAILARERVYPFAMESVTEEGSFPTFSQAIEEVILPGKAETMAEPAIPVKSRKAKAQDVVQQQKRALEGYLKAAEENQAKGETIYMHYQDVDKLLKAINEDRKTLSWKELKEKYKEQRIDESKGEIVVEL